MNVSYPSPGPKNGIKMKTAETGPRVLARNVSDSEPAATAKTGAQHNPAMNLKKHKAPKLCVKPAPSVKRAPSGTEPT